MKKLILSILLVAGLFGEEDISYKISGKIGSEYTVKFITYFEDNVTKYLGYADTHHKEEIEVQSGDYNISIPLTYTKISSNPNNLGGRKFKITGMELRITTKNAKGMYSVFPILGYTSNNGGEVCDYNHGFVSAAQNFLNLQKTGKPIYSGFTNENGYEVIKGYKSYSFMPSRFITSKSIFRLTPKSDFICDTKGLFSVSASLCQMKALLDTNGGLYHYIGEEKDNCHSLTHPDFGVDKIENSSLVINVSHEKINDF